ncbi:MAG: hypothetical protein ABI912_08835 [Actinomycetota bacterium]
MPADDVRVADEILAQFTDSASARFDQSLGGMPLDETQRRELRYWQRQSLASLRQYAAVAVPGALAAISAAQSEAKASLEDAGSAWAEAHPAGIDEGDALLLDESAFEPTPPDSLELRRRSVAARLASGA